MPGSYSYNERCPVCDRDIKRRPADFAGRPCADCMTNRVSRRDAYRLRNARLTDEAITDIITRARATGATEGTDTCTRGPDTPTTQTAAAPPASEPSPSP